MSITAAAALEKLKKGNLRYLHCATNAGDISAAMRKKTAIEGQQPYAAVITCSDSRVIPEAVFSAGIGELFVIRSAGNVIDGVQLGSIEYAVEHLGCRLVLVLGHSLCGAVGAALGNGGEGFIRLITDEIRAALGGETDYLRAAELNASNGVNKIKACLELPEDVLVAGAVYDIEDGRVEFI